MSGRPDSLLKVVVFKVIGQFGLGHPGEVLKHCCGEPGDSERRYSPETEHSCLLAQLFPICVPGAQRLASWEVDHRVGGALEQLQTHEFEYAFVGVLLVEYFRGEDLSRAENTHLPFYLTMRKTVWVP